MSFKTDYLNSIYENVCAKNANEPEFLQTVQEVLESIEPVLEARPDLVQAGVIERMVEPSVPFHSDIRDDNGKVQVNRGYRVQFNSAIGPYKGGIRFAPNVNSNRSSASSRPSRTPYRSPMGGGKGGLISPERWK